MSHNEISVTAYFTLGGRIDDNKSPRPACGDYLAEKFLDKESAPLCDQFKEFATPNKANNVRHGIIDKAVQEELSKNPKTRVVVIGCGFDTRAFRLKGGRFIELDEPAIIDKKNQVLPIAECPNELVRLPIRFKEQDLEEILSKYSSGEKTIVIVEGVFFFLKNEQKFRLIDVLKKTFPCHFLYCDLMTNRFFHKMVQPLHNKFVSLGTRYYDLQDVPANQFLERGYIVMNVTSITRRVVDLGLFPLIPSLFVRVSKMMQQGYQVFQLGYGIKK